MWVYETDENGKIWLQYATPISGDAVFTDAGVTTLPVGTYVIEETKAPTGYLLPACQGRTFIEVVNPRENSDATNPETYHTETYKPISTETGKKADGSTYTYTGLNWSEWKIDGEK